MTRRNNVRPVRRNRNVRQRGGRRGPPRRSRNNRSVLPPAKTIMGHLMRTVIQTAWDVAQGALKVSRFTQSPFVGLPHVHPTPISVPEPNPIYWKLENMKDSDLFSQGWLDRLKGLFREYKVHSIVAHYMPYAPSTAMGEYCFTLYDEGENDVSTSFSTAIGTPASVVRRTSQPSRLMWYPTEPEDRNWHSFGDAHKWTSATIAAAEAVYHAQPDVPNSDDQSHKEAANIAGKIVIEVDVSARGKPSSTKRAFAPYGSVEFSEYQELIQCDCRKCLRIARLSSIRTHTTLSTPIHDLEIV